MLCFVLPPVPSLSLWFPLSFFFFKMAPEYWPRILSRTIACSYRGRWTPPDCFKKGNCGHLVMLLCFG